MSLQTFRRFCIHKSTKKQVRWPRRTQGRTDHKDCSLARHFQGAKRKWCCHEWSKWRSSASSQANIKQRLEDKHSPVCSKAWSSFEGKHLPGKQLVRQKRAVTVLSRWTCISLEYMCFVLFFFPKLSFSRKPLVGGKKKGFLKSFVLLLPPWKSCHWYCQPYLPGRRESFTFHACGFGNEGLGWSRQIASLFFQQ